MSVTEDVKTCDISTTYLQFCSMWLIQNLNFYISIINSESVTSIISYLQLYNHSLLVRVQHVQTVICLQIYYDDDNVATLIIREVFPEDAGVYTCVAKNFVGFASSTTELTVDGPLSDHGSDITSGLSRRSLSRQPI